jgi:hypothetical protein
MGPKPPQNPISVPVVLAKAMPYNGLQDGQNGCLTT